MAGVVLRDYQEEQIQRVRAAMASWRRVLLQAPTGAGKTALASYMTSKAAESGRVIWFICHRAELVAQTSYTFQKFGIVHSFVAAGRPIDLSCKVMLCSVDTLKNRLLTLPPPDLVIWDECHHLGAAGWSAIMEKCPKARHVGLSATPERLDGKGLDGHFDALVLGPEPAWLIDQGHLSDYKLFAPPAPADLKAGGMDDGRGKQAKVLNVPKLTGDVVAHWLKQANGMRTVGFACNVAHSLSMVEAFNAAGIPAAHLDGGTQKAERVQVIRDFAAGRILVLWNVSLFGEGFDLAAIAQTDVTIDCAILNRKTSSLSLFLQMVGRVLRPAPGKTAIILDHAGNSRQHGYPCDAREWALEGRKAGGPRAANDDGPPPPVICDGCFMSIRRPLPSHCPHCSKEIRLVVKEIEVGEGELEEATPDARRAARREQQREERECTSLGELVALGQRRGYPSPSRWAFKRWEVHPARKVRQAA